MRFIFRLLQDFRIQIIINFLLLTFLAISMVSYNREDPSWNNYSENEPDNLMGAAGSIVSDIMLQIFGTASVFYLLLLGLWVKKLWQNRFMDGWGQKIGLGFIAVSLISCSFGMLEFKFLPPHFGGIIGVVMKPYCLLLGPIAPVVTFILGIMVLVVASNHDLRYFFYWIGHLIGRIVHKGGSTMSYVPNITPPSFFTKSDTQSVVKTDPILAQKTMPEIKKPILPIMDISSVQEGRPVSFVPSTEGHYQLPSIDLLDIRSNDKIKMEKPSELQERAEKLMQVLADFGVRGTILDIHQGPVVTLYEFEPSAGTKSSRVIGLSDDIARSLSAISTRIAIIPGRNALGIEIPNANRQFFSLRELIETSEYQAPGLALPIILGKNLGGGPAVVDLAKMPHLLVAGTTGSGKSVAINAMIISLLYSHTADECKFIMIDPKMLELSVYQDIPHLLTPVVTEPGKAVIALKWAVREMENRYRLMSNLNVRNISGYNDRIKEAIAKGEILERTAQTGFDQNTGKPIYESIPMDMKSLPFIVVIVDEMADLMLVAGKDIEGSIQRLAQMARAAGIHIIMATQRPSVDVITGVIKANFPSRVSFKVTSKIDSRTILGDQGAEQLLGMGDMLYVSSTSSVSRLHGPFVSDKEVERVAKFLKEQGSPSYLTSVVEVTDESGLSGSDIDGQGDDDELYKQAVEIVKRDRKASTSYIQRCLRIGYNRAAIMIERMEREGIVSEPGHTGRREIILEE
jgi:S-DNA-T family DNA segregation ATPase FtsK/SpoIIIE